MTMPEGQIDWKTVKNRLDKNGKALKKALKPNAAQIKTAYKKRAARLAVRGTKETTQNIIIPVLSFWIGNEHYAIAMKDLTEVLQKTTCAAIPGMSSELLGVVNLHGEIRPVLNTHIILGLPKQEEDTPGYIIFLRRKNKSEVGLMVDRIDEVRLIKEEELTVPKGDDSGLPGRFIKGVTPDTIILIDAAGILSLGILSEEQ